MYLLLVLLLFILFFCTAIKSRSKLIFCNRLLCIVNENFRNALRHLTFIAFTSQLWNRLIDHFF